MPPLTLATMPRDIYGYCTAYSSMDETSLVTRQCTVQAGPDLDNERPYAISIFSTKNR